MWERLWILCPDPNTPWLIKWLVLLPLSARHKRSGTTGLSVISIMWPGEVCLFGVCNGMLYKWAYYQRIYRSLLKHSVTHSTHCIHAISYWFTISVNRTLYPIHLITNVQNRVPVVFTSISLVFRSLINVCVLLFVCCLFSKYQLLLPHFRVWQ